MEKTIFPIKTKIAAWWMISIGGVIVCYYMFALIYLLVSGFPKQPPTSDFSVFISIITKGLFFASFALFFFLPAFFLLKSRKWAWRGSGLILFISIMIALFFAIEIAKTEGVSSTEFITTVIITIIFMIPFILLLLDRKNFFKIVPQTQKLE